LAAVVCDDAVIDWLLDADPALRWAAGGRFAGRHELV
jgi:hypothetical protein